MSVLKLFERDTTFRAVAPLYVEKPIFYRRYEQCVYVEGVDNAVSRQSGFMARAIYLEVAEDKNALRESARIAHEKVGRIRKGKAMMPKRNVDGMATMLAPIKYYGFEARVRK